VASHQDETGTAARRLTQRLEALEQAGVTHLPRRRLRGKQHLTPGSASSRQAGPSPAREGGGKQQGACVELVAEVAEKATGAGIVVQSTVAAVVRPEPAAGLLPDAIVEVVPAAERPAQLDIVRREVASCTRCAELATTRTQTVFGVGNPNARLMFIGEAPGADEDRRGEPFVGKAGQLLNKIIEACRMKREDVYIGNVIKCRPPGNRNPLPDEIGNCRGYLDRQLAIIRPEFICCLGAVAAKALLNTEASIGRLRGRFYRYEGIDVICTYHPAYLLRNPSAKRDVWDDMKLLMARMGIAL
jgi:uracil-DNA glycosylase